MSADTHIETETTFDVPGVVAVADLAAVDGVTEVAEPVVQELDAEYFDTAELSLLAADIGLRRRRGGDDAGWHVKIARSKGERVEIHEPLGAGRRQPPKALRDLVTAPDAADTAPACGPGPHPSHPLPAARRTRGIAGRGRRRHRHRRRPRPGAVDVARDRGRADRR